MSWEVLAELFEQVGILHSHFLGNRKRRAGFRVGLNGARVQCEAASRSLRNSLAGGSLSSQHSNRPSPNFPRQ